MSTAAKVLDALRSYDLKQIKPGEWQSNSPLRPGSNSHAFNLKITDDEHGAWYDFPADESGSLYDLAKRLNIDTPKRAPVADTKRKYDGLADYAKAHFVEPDVFIKAGWSETTHNGRAALAFKTISGDRYRFIDGGSGSYINKPGYASCLYGLKTAPEMARAAQSPLIICNGEASTVVAQFYGVPAVCQTGGEKKWKTEHIKQLHEAWSGDILIALDCDDTGRRVAGELAGQFGERARVIDLELGDHGDLADFCGLYGKNALTELVKRAAVAPKADSQKTDAELLSDQLAQLTAAMRDKDRGALELETVIAQVQGTLDRVSMGLVKPTVLTMKDAAVDLYRDLLDARMDSENIGGLRMGFPTMDKTIGEMIAEFYLLIGASGSGKTWVMVSIAREVCNQGDIFVASTEMRVKRWMRRLVATSAKVDDAALKRGTLPKAEWERAVEQIDRFERMSGAWLDAPSPTVNMLRAAVLRGLDAGADYQAIFVDSMSKMRHPGTTSIYERMSAVADGLQDLSREVDLPVLATSQLGSDVSQRASKIPTMDDGYGGRVATHNAGAVFVLYNDHYYAKQYANHKADPDLPRGTILFRLVKLRDEDDGNAPGVHLLWQPGGSGYVEKARHYQTVSLNTGDRKDHD